MSAVIIDDDGDNISCASAMDYSADRTTPQQTSLFGESAMDSPMDDGNDFDTVKVSREREGRCGDCGMQTHELHDDPLTKQKVKVPLTIPREVRRGRCLFCYPVFSPQFLNQQLSTVQQGAKPTLPKRTLRSVSTLSESPTTRRVSYVDNNNNNNNNSNINTQGYHRPSDPMVQQALAVLNSNSRDIVDLLSAMKAVPHDRKVQERGCERLWVLSWDDETAAALGRVGGVAVLLDALARFPMNAHLQQCGCECLQNMAALNEYNRRDIYELGGIVLMVQAMIRHQNVAGIQQCGCTALASMAVCQSYHADITRAGGFHATLSAARNFPNQESVLRAAYDAISSLGYDPAGRLPFCPEVVPVVIEPFEEGSC